MTLSQRDLWPPPIKRETYSSAVSDQLKSEHRSQSSAQAIASAFPQQSQTMLTSSASAHRAMTPISSLVSSMVDNTAYVPARTRSPSAGHEINTRDKQIAKNSATSSALVLPNTADSEHWHPIKRVAKVWIADHNIPSNPARNTASAYEQPIQQNDPVPTSTAGVTALPSDALPSATGFSLDKSQAISASLNASLTPSHQRKTQTLPAPKVDKAKCRTPRSLYPGPSSTMPSLDLLNSGGARKRSRTARSDHPERFLYAGNTFSNLDDRTFLDTAESNPYLSQLTSDASRPVYKTPLEARLALKGTDKPVIAPLDYDQQIQQLMDTIAIFRKKYEKSKMMTRQAGIQIEGNVWDRLSNMVQYPPDFDAYARKGRGDLERYAEEMKAWDQAIGHQVIIKKRIVYKEAIEKLQVKLGNLEAERRLDSHNTQLKRKAAEAADDTKHKDS